MLAIKQLWQLGLPLSLSLVISMAIVMIDSAFAGNISYFDLAAVSLGGGVFYICLLPLIGIGIGSSVMAGQAQGAENQAQVINCFRQGILLCITIGLVFSVFMPLVTPLLIRLGQDPQVIELASKYLAWIAWTIPLQGLGILFRSYFGIIDQPWKSVPPIFIVLLLNAALNYALTTGPLGIPKLGISGIGIASLISSVVLVLLMLRNIGWPVVRTLFEFNRPEVWQNNALGKVLMLSLPIALSLLVEEVYFSGSIFLAGYLGAAEQAAQQILLNTVGTSFLFNTGIGMACAIIIGKHIGAKRYQQIMPTIKASWILVQVFTIPFALILALFIDPWISLFLDPTITNNNATISFVKNVIWLAIIMLFIDAIWLVTTESLHGMLDTTFPAIATLTAFWFIGVPLAFYSSQNYPNGFFAIWAVMLLVASLLTILVILRMRYKVSTFAHPTSPDKPL